MNVTLKKQASPIVCKRTPKYIFYILKWPWKRKYSFNSM